MKTLTTLLVAVSLSAMANSANAEWSVRATGDNALSLQYSIPTGGGGIARLNAAPGQATQKGTTKPHSKVQAQNVVLGIVGTVAFIVLLNKLSKDKCEDKCRDFTADNPGGTCTCERA